MELFVKEIIQGHTAARPISVAKSNVGIIVFRF